MVRVQIVLEYMSRKLLLGLIGLTAGLLILVSGCKHDPFIVEIEPMDTISVPIDTLPCDPDYVYFQRDILPILSSNCALSGCHDEQTARDGVILTTYQKTMETGGIVPGDPSKSELFEVLVSTDLTERMPPSPAEKLGQVQIDLIEAWIMEGARDSICIPDTSCILVDVSFSTQVMPVIQTHCTSCHSGSSPQAGIALTDHANVKAAADSGQLYGSIARLSGFAPMPQGQDKLPQCTIDQIKAWIDAGTPDN